MPTYSVQLLRVVEVTVQADDELQAERKAYLDTGRQDNEIAIRVQEANEADGGALESEENEDNWRFAKKHFHALNKSWVEG